MKIISLLISGLLMVQLCTAQSVPQGMKYQAVARDQQGKIWASRDLQLKITLYSEPVQKDIAYIEIQKITTNELGLFSLSIGGGIPIKGSFEEVPWSTGEIWMEVAVQTDDETDFVTISDSKMLSVPYAFHAATASELTGPGNVTRGGSDPGAETAEWLLDGNKNTDPQKHKLGTRDEVDLVLVTNDLERIRILNKGDVVIRNDLYAEQNVHLNAVGGETFNYGNLTVIGKTHLKDNMAVEGAAYLHNFLQVDKYVQVLDNTQSMNPATGALVVTGGAGIGGNLNIGGDFSLLGNANFAGLMHITNQTQSSSTTTGALVVDGGVGIGKRLNVGEATRLNSTLDVLGATNITNTLGVTGVTTITNTTQATSKDNGALIVDGGVGIEKNLFVGGTANFGGAATFGGKIHITDVTQSTNTATGALVVDGGLGVAKNLNVGGTLGVKGSDSGFLASIDNSNSSEGDGLEIKLGRTHPAWNGSSYLHLTSPGAEFFDDAIETIRGWIDGSEAFDPLDLLNFIPTAYIAGTACNLVNLLTEQLNESIGLPLNISDPINDALGLPLDIGAEINSGLGLPAGFSPYGVINDVCDVCVDDDDLPGPFWTIAPALPTNVLVLPAMPDFELPAIPEIPVCDALPSFTLPVISFVDVDNSLDNNNQFISFKDVDNRELGSIRAQSVSDWQVNYFSGAYIVNILASVVGIDFVGGIVGAISEFTNIADAYNSIGVEYASGNGDYAEWLERVNPAEVISDGDIVGVAGGKITKDLSKAEQVMAVSAKPIMLGNSPKAGLESTGNKIAFMGQIPVKIQGPVASGDYIVGNAATPGYGIAVNPSKMTREQALLVVGRAWDTNSNAGPKMVNTVIGVDNGQFLKVLQDSHDEMQSSRSQVTELEARIKELEAKMEVIVTSLPGFQEASDKAEKGKAPKPKQ